MKTVSRAYANRLRRLVYSALFLALALLLPFLTGQIPQIGSALSPMHIPVLLGRVVWGCVQFVLAGLQSTTFPLSAFWAGAVTSAIPGIICHIVLIPILVMALQRGGVVLNGAAVDAPVGTRRAVSPHGAV